MSLGETLFASIKTALERIDGTGSYHNTVPAARIQRYSHVISDEEHTLNSIRQRPAILIHELSDSGDPGVVNAWARSIVVDVAFLFEKGVTCAEIQLAKDDMLRALFASWDGFGVGVAEPRWHITRINPETDAPWLEGLHLELTLGFMAAFDDPDTGA